MPEVDDRGGLEEALGVTAQPRNWMRERDPSWPTPQGRDEDFQTLPRSRDLVQLLVFLRCSAKISAAEPRDAFLKLRNASFE